jgi:hypothetical protein
MESAAGLQAPHIPNNPGAIGERLLKMTANLTTAREAAARLGGIESLPSPAQIRFTRRRSYPRRRLGEAGSKFDTSRFESWQPSQPLGSLAEIPRHSENRRYFNMLTTNSLASGQ